MSWEPSEVVQGMATSLEHRGPDDAGLWADDTSGVYLAFRRLAILDLSEAGRQPMISASGRYVILFNGEVYNFKELRSTLDGLGYRFRGHSDTEILLAAFEQWGVRESVRRFQGMFAIALWDSWDRRLWLARDRVGIKPLFVLETTQGLAFASEARAFHVCPLWERTVDPAGVCRYLERLYVPGPLSILSGVRKVAPGEVVEFVVEDGRAKERSRDRYWSLGDVARRAQSELVSDETEAVERLHGLLHESVRMRLVADVPVGAFLSGGIDSTIVVALMRELSAHAPRTFTISFDDPDFDEGPHAASVAEWLGADHTSISFRSDEVLEHLPTLPGLCDEPMANPSLLPTLLVSRVAREQVVVALSGDGGDELFGGYNRYLHGAALIRRMRRLPRPMRDIGAAVLRLVANTSGAGAAVGMWRSSTVGRQHHPSERVRKVARMLNAESAPAAYMALLQVGLFEPPLSGIDCSQLGRSPEFSCDLPNLESQMMLLDQEEYLPDDLLAKVDRASMWESLEVRVPMLDHRVVEFSWRIPVGTKLRDGTTKWPLRKIAERYVPREMMERPKMGFTVPISRWMRGELRDWARDTLSPGRGNGSVLWDRTRLEKLWRQFDGGRSDLALPLWTAVVLQAWADAWKVSLR